MDADYDRWRTKVNTDAHRVHSFFRFRAINLWHDWDRFTYEEVEGLLVDYLHDLCMNFLHMYEDQREVKDDLKILTGLLTILKSKIAEAEIRYNESEIAFFYATKKVGMMLQKIESMIKEGKISDGVFPERIRGLLRKVEWKQDLNFVIKNTKALAAGAQFAEQIKAFEEFNVEDIGVEKTDDIVKRLEEYLGEQENADPYPAEATSYVSVGPDLCELIKHVMCKLTDICPPDDGIKEETSDGVWPDPSSR